MPATRKPAEPNKHQQRTEATRAKLLEAALQVFARDGFERARLEDIAAEAGHTRGAFYAHFATKEDLFIALLELQASKRIAAVTKAVEQHDSDEGKLEATRNWYIQTAKDRTWMILTLEFKLYALRHNEARAQLAAAHQRIRDSFQVEIQSRLAGHPHLLADTEKHAKITLEVIWSGLVLENAYDPRRLPGTSVSQLLGRMFDLVVKEKLLNT